MKNNRFLSVILAIIVLIGTVVSFLVVKDKNSFFWISYVFSLIAFILIYVFSVYLRGNSLKMQNIGVSLITLSVIYLIVDIAIILLFACALTVPGAAYFSIHLIAFSIFIIMEIAAFNSKKAMVSEKNETKNRSIDWRKLYTDVESLIPSSNEDMKPVLTDLYEKLKYSDPVGSPELIDMDINIQTYVQDIEEMICEKSSIDEIKDQADKIIKLVDERNIKLKSLK